MSVFKNSFSVAAPVTPSDTVNIPFPNIVKSATVTSITPNTRLIDSTADFVEIGIKVGDTVFCEDNGQYAYVTSVFPTYLTLSADIFTVVGQTYKIFQGENNGCYIYVGGVSVGSNVEVLTIGGNVVTFSGVQTGQILPVQVKKVLPSGTTANLLIALW